ncbi:MAG: hypothetical protein MUC89_08235 [Acetobacteraceae bacterium]|jgi:hypothetical protein|nr:hypothetical protein [Acetobacteraceae bacterium]
MSVTGQFIQNHARILAAPHSFELDPTAPKTAEALAMKLHGGNVTRYTQKSAGPYYGTAIGRPLNAYNGALVSGDGPHVVSMINGRETPKMARDIYAVRLDGTRADEGVRFLPWAENMTTFTRLDMANDRLFFTGPLQGCHIYVARQGTAWYVVHVNYNKDPSPEANLSAKETFYQLAQNFFDGMGVTDVGALRRADYDPGAHAAYNAFAYGVRTDTWRFYVHAASNAGAGWGVHIASRQFA